MNNTILRGAKIAALHPHHTQRPSGALDRLLSQQGTPARTPLIPRIELQRLVAAMVD